MAQAEKFARIDRMGALVLRMLLLGVGFGAACGQDPALNLTFEEDSGAIPVCPMHYDPVCGEDGKTYGNACQARAAKVAVAHTGECSDAAPVVCPMHYDPVCGEDGKTYGNACEAGAAKVAVAYTGKCIVVLVY